MKTRLLVYVNVLLYLLVSQSAIGQVNRDSLWAIWEDESQLDTNRLNAIHDFTPKEYPFSKPDSALYFASLEYEFAKAVGKKKWIAKAEMAMAFPYYIKGNYAKFIEHTKNAVQLLEEIGNEKQLSSCLVNLGAAYGQIGDLDGAFEVLSKNLILQEKLGDRKTTGQTLNNLSSILMEKNDYSGALNCLLKALKIGEEIGNFAGAASACRNIGNVYLAVNEYDKVFEYYHRALEFAEKVDNPFLLASTYTALGDYYGGSVKRDFDEAIVWQTKALDSYKSVGNKELEAYLMSILGRSYEEKGDWEKATAYYQQCLAISENIQKPRDVGAAWTGMGRIEMNKNNYNKSLNFANRALRELKDHYEITIDRQVAKVLYKSHRALGNYEEALLAHEKYKTLVDSMRNENNKKQVLRQEFKFNYNKQALADSLAFAQKEAITNLELEKNQVTLSQQRLGLVATILGLLLLSFLAYFFYQSKKNQEAEANRVRELDAFKSTFYTNITHEFRTPLTVILGMVQQLKAQPEKYLEEGTELIERNGKNLLNQINQILDLSKLETNALQLNRIQDDIVEFLRYSTEAFQSFANGQNLSLRFFTPTEKLLMDFDPDSIQNIMSNLISNAMKFTPEGGDVKVSLEEREKNLMIKVQDTGVGISDKDLPHIFDRFYQVENKNDQNTYGTGIGLAYVKELVKVLGGDIKVESQLGKGTTFTVQLPIRNEAPIQQSVETQKTSSTWKPVQQRVDRIGTSVIKPATVSTLSTNQKDLPQLLLIEDNADVVIYLKSCLSDLYQIEVAYNGKIGIEKALENIPDLIISDVMMPEKDGYEVCDLLKNDERTSHIPLILLTAKADDASKLAGLKRGADAYLSKPFDKEELLVRLERLLAKQKKLQIYFSKTDLIGSPLIKAEQEIEEAVSVEDVFVQKVRGIVEANYQDEDFSLPQLCQKIGMSRSQLFRKMKALMEVSPSDFIRSYRLQKAKKLLENSEMNVAEVAYEVGFKDPSYFTKVFQERFSVLPRDL